MNSRFFKIIIGVLFYPYGIYLIWKHNKNKKEDKLLNEKEDKQSRQSKYQLIWKKKDQELVDLFHFLLGGSTLKLGGYKIFRSEDQVIKSTRIQGFISIEYKSGHLSLSIREQEGNLEFRGLDHNIKKIQIEQKRIDWVNSNLNKKGFDILKFILEEKEILVKKEKEIIKLLDKDGNGIIDVIEGQDDFMTLFKKHQKKVLETDKSYIQNFVKTSNHLKTKRENLQNIFTTLNTSSNQKELDEMVGILKNQIHSYELILLHSLNMITSIVKDDLITFYEIYESFDKLNIFNSNWENEISQKLTDIGSGINDLMYSIQKMEMNIVSGLNTLSYLTQEGFSDLNSSLTQELQSINSSIDLNNLLTGISTYQLYNINKQTKGLIE